MSFDWLRRFTKKEKNVSPSKATADLLSQAMRGECPRCKSDLHSHAFQIFAITVASLEKKEVVSDFIRKARNHDWESLSKFSDFDPMKNALEACALRCEDNRLSLLLVRNPFELFDDSSVEDWEALDENESSKWLGYLPNEKWVCFDSGRLAAEVRQRA